MDLRPASFGRYLSDHMRGAAQSESESKITQRLFLRASIECRTETAWGDTVVLCGSTEQLGSWQPERALRMATDEAIYPIWRCEPLLLCSEDVEFKFVIVRGDGSAVWEPLASNRKLVLGSVMDDVQVVAEFGSPAAWPPAPAPSPLIGRNRAPGASGAGSYDGVPQLHYGGGSCGGYSSGGGSSGSGLMSMGMMGGALVGGVGGGGGGPSVGGGVPLSPVHSLPSGPSSQQNSVHGGSSTHSGGVGGSAHGAGGPMLGGGGGGVGGVGGVGGIGGGGGGGGGGGSGGGGGGSRGGGPRTPSSLTGPNSTPTARIVSYQTVDAAGF